MCNPMVAFAITAASSVMNYVGGQQQAKYAAEAASQQAQLSYQQIKEQQQQTNEQSFTEQTERMKQGMLERAQIATIAGESGALGFSTDRLLGDSFMQQGVDISSMETNRLNAIKQSTWEAEQARAGAASRATEAYAKAPTLLGTGLQIAGDASSMMSKIKAGTTAKTDVKVGSTDFWKGTK